MFEIGDIVCIFSKARYRIKNITCNKFNTYMYDLVDIKSGKILLNVMEENLSLDKNLTLIDKRKIKIKKICSKLEIK